jgi:hypothetical protein
MNKRECLLSRAWTGPELVLDGRALALSTGRYELLRYWKNSIMAEIENEQTQVGALHEIAWVMWLTKDEIKAAQRMTTEKRREAVVNFALDYEDELAEIQDGIMERFRSIQAATVESDSPGKELVHAS